MNNVVGVYTMNEEKKTIVKTRKVKILKKLVHSRSNCKISGNRHKSIPIHIKV